MVHFLLRLFIGLLCVHSVAAQNSFFTCPDKPDVTVKIMGNINCSAGVFSLNVRLCNSGQLATTQPVNVVFYDANPFTTAAKPLPLGFQTMPNPLSPGVCVDFFMDADPSWLLLPKVFVLIGGKDDVKTPISLSNFPLPEGFEECDYANNLDSITLQLPPLKKLDLGPDRSICVGQSIALDAGPDFIFYQWQGGPTAQAYTVADEGTYFLRVIDACGRQQFDTVSIKIQKQPKRTVNIAFLPGDSVIIRGKIYKSSVTFVDTIPSLPGPCDTLVTYNLRLDELHCTGRADAFFQAHYKENLVTAGRVVLVAADGSIYTAGEFVDQNVDNELSITKSKANGEVIWSRRFEFVNNSIFSQLIEDSEGNLVGTLTQLATIHYKPLFICFRYDPKTDKVLWTKNINTGSTGPVPVVLTEKSPGGNFAVCYYLTSTGLGSFSEIAELERSSGALIGGKVFRYGPGVTLLGGAVRNGLMYGHGFVRDSSTGSIAVRGGFLRIDLETGELQEQKTYSVAGKASVASGPTALDQEGNLVTLLYESDKTIWLRKTTRNGNPMWLKRFTVNGLNINDLNVPAVAATNDGYVIVSEIFLLNGQVSLGIIKTDKNGNLLWAKYLNSGGISWGRSHQMLQTDGENVYITGVFSVPDPAKSTGALLVKLDKNGSAGNGCNLLSDLFLTSSDIPFVAEPTEVGSANNTRNADSNMLGSRGSYALDIYTFCSKCADLCAITLNIGPDRFICSGDSVLLKANEDFAAFKWQDGSTAPQFLVSQAGVYHIETTDKCGVVHRDTVWIYAQIPPVREEIVVLLPGESITIGGKTFTKAGKTSIVIPSKTGICDTTVNYTIVISASGCKQPKSFLKISRENVGRIVVASADGSIYVLGEYLANTSSNTLCKLDTLGNMLWARQIISTHNIGDVAFYPQAMIEDSEGMLVGCGNATQSTATFVAFRYDPKKQQMLWSRSNNVTGFVLDVLEEKLGGHFVVLQEMNNVGDTKNKSEIMRLDRATGAIIGDQASRYDPGLFQEGLIDGKFMYVSGVFEEPGQASLLGAGIAKIDLSNDKLLWARKMKTNNAYEYGGEDVLKDSDGNILGLFSKYNEFILQKISPDGDLIWNRKYTLGPNQNGIGIPYSMRKTEDGHYVVCMAGSDNSGGQVLTIAKISNEGPMLWARTVRGLQTFGNHRAQYMDVIKNNIYFTYGGTEPHTMLFGKFDANGEISSACVMVDQIKMSYTTSILKNVASTMIESTRPREAFALNLYPSTVLNYVPKFVCIKCENYCDTIRTTQNITFYKGDTVVVNGNPYTASDTVVLFLTASTGCDSVATIILTQITSNLDIKCPNDLTVTLPPNTVTTKVDYNLPTASTDCNNPKITLKLLQGPPVAGDFKQGITKVCYEAANECMAKDTCCFNVTVVNPETPCDIKTGPNCMRYELLTVKFDAKGQRRYRVRVSNTCATAVQFVYIETPKGVNAVSPAGASQFVSAPSGRTYEVRNPNASPFASIRFKAQSSGLKGGASDVFEYTLPQQSAPNYILVGARLENGDYYETYLNTFNCPAQPYDGNKNRENDAENRVWSAYSLRVFPNPNNGVLYVSFPDKQNMASQDKEKGEKIKLLIANAMGQVVYQSNFDQGTLWDTQTNIVLDERLANGLYLLSVIWPDGSSTSERFVLGR